MENQHGPMTVTEKSVTSISTCLANLTLTLGILMSRLSWRLEYCSKRFKFKVFNCNNGSYFYLKKYFFEPKGHGHSKSITLIDISIIYVNRVYIYIYSKL